MRKILLIIQSFVIVIFLYSLIAFTGFIIGVGTAYNYPNETFRIFINNPDSVIKMQKINE